MRCVPGSVPGGDETVTDNGDGDDDLGDGERNAKAFLSDAYALRTQSDTRAFYERWADEYDAQLEAGLHYVAPRALAAALARHLAPGRGPILDVGCGTGMTCAHLRCSGFACVDGIDFSRSMLAKAGEKGIYRALYEADLNVALPFEDGCYAAAISTGTFTLGHVGPQPIDELLRILEPGALLACTVHAGVWDARGFADKFSALQDNGTLHVIEQTTGVFFEDGAPEARYCVFRKPAG